MCKITVNFKPKMMSELFWTEITCPAVDKNTTVKIKKVKLISNF